MDDPFTQNVIGVTDLVENETNKTPGGAVANGEGVKNEKYDSLELKMTDEELLALRDSWVKRYANQESKMKTIFARNLEAYTGKKATGQWADGSDIPLAGNLQFEAMETFLAAALAKNPEPVCYSDNTPEGDAMASDIKTMLQYHADQLVLRRKLAAMVRQWSIYHLGVLKLGWDAKLNDVSIMNRKIQDFVFDPDGYVDAFGDFTSYVGERITVTAEKLIELYPSEKMYITLIVNGNMGTDVVYTEWRTDEFTFTTFKDKVLDKHKNEYFKYPEIQKDPLGQPMKDMMGKPVMTQPRNHFAYAKKPYVFLSIFSLQTQPHDLTGLIEQNIPNQNLITKRTEQIDKNISASNNGFAFSMKNFNEETAKQAAVARQKGNPILIPQGGNPGEAILPLAAQALPASVFDELEINKNNLRSSWGIQGITSQPPNEDQTARGMILNQSHDTSRIGGSIGDAIEQVADNVFNWLTQLYYVFYDEPHFASIMGNAKANEYVVISSQNLTKQIIVSVSPDSMRPRDEVTEANLATSLFQEGVIGPKTLLKMLSFPNPDEAAADGLLYKMDPQAYMQLNFPEFAQQLQASQQQQGMQEAQNAGMKTAAVAANTPPEVPTDPAPLSQDPASAALSNVPLPH